MDFASQLKTLEKLLKKRAFVGYYTERRLVEEIQDYRDAVWLDPEENELAEDLSFANKICRGNCFPSFQISPLPTLLVTLADIPLGCHWFQITSISFEYKEIIYNLKSLRYFPGVEYKAKQTPNNSRNLQNVDNLSESIQNTVNVIIQSINGQTALGFIRFIAILITTLITGLFQVLFFVGEISIKAMNEASRFVEASTPVFLGSLEFLSKIIGGFYILLAMMWRGTNTSHPPSRPAIEPLRHRKLNKTSTHNFHYD